MLGEGAHTQGEGGMGVLHQANALTQPRPGDEDYIEAMLTPQFPNAINNYGLLTWLST